MKKKIMVAIILITSFLISGCWDYIEYEHMAMVSSAGIDFDKDSGNITVTVEIIEAGKSGGQGLSNGGGQKGGKSKSSGEAVVLSATDVTISDALAKIQQAIGRSLFFAYQQIIVVNEDAAKNIMEEIIGLLDRTPQIRSTSYLLITPQRSEDVLSTMDPDISELSGKRIYNLVKMSNNTGYSSEISIKDFAQAMAVEGIEAVAPGLVVQNSGSSEENQMPQNEKNNIRQLAKFVGAKEGYHIVEGIAAFEGVKLKGWLNARESMGWAWITDKSIKTYKTTKSSEETYTKEIAEFRITRSKSTIKPKLENNKPAIQLDVHVEAAIIKSKKNTDLLTPDALSYLEKDLSDSIRNDIEASLRKVQKKLKTDIFGFGFSFYRKYPKLWHSKYEREWEKVFPDIPVSVNVDVKIINTGTTIRRFVFK